MKIRVLSIGGEDGEASAYAEDIAWEHSTMLAERLGLDLGSDGFVSIFNRLSEKYGECAESFGFLHNLAARTLKELMEAGVAIALPPDEDEAAVTARFYNLVACIFTAIAWAYASGPDAWIENDEWDEHTEDERSIDFYVVRPTIKIGEGTDADDR